MIHSIICTLFSLLPADTLQYSDTASSDTYIKDWHSLRQHPFLASFSYFVHLLHYPHFWKSPLPLLLAQELSWWTQILGVLPFHDTALIIAMEGKPRLLANEKSIKMWSARAGHKTDLISWQDPSCLEIDCTALVDSSSSFQIIPKDFLLHWQHLLCSEH